MPGAAPLPGRVIPAPGAGAPGRPRRRGRRPVGRCGRPVAAVLAFSGVLSVVASVLEARPLRPGETILDRPRPEVTAHGGRLGRLWIRPTLTTALAFDDNVFANDAQRRSDVVLRTRPAVSAATDWRGHRASVSAAAEQGTYLEQSDENYLDLTAKAYARVHLSRDIHASATARWRRGHVPRQSVESQADARAPTLFRARGGEVLVKHRGEITDLSGSVRVRRLDYDDVATRDGGRLNNDDRDHWVAELTLADRMRLTHRLDRFARTRINVRRYYAPVDDQGYTRDSYGHATVAGLTWRPTGLTTLEGYGGVRQQIYADARFDPLFIPTAGFRVVTSPSQLTSVRLAVDQAVRETTTEAASGRLITTLSATVDHELRRDLLARLQLNAGIDDPRGVARWDQHLAAGASLTYLVSRHLHARLSVQHARLDVHGARARAFQRNRVEVSLEVRY